tara:strand:+ start:879 stop:1544 length:666 start_codon:yes stop_codon:yes gene_type:complete
MPARRELIYPIILQCCSHANDTYWENILEDIAYGRAPYHTYITNDNLTSSTKNGEFSINLAVENASPEELCNKICNTLREKVGIMSRMERIQSKEKFNSHESRLHRSQDNWSMIKKKNLKDLLVENYIVRMKEKHDLSVAEARKALSLIFVAMVFKVITQKDIHYYDGKIHDIEGISFSDKKIIMEREIYSTEKDHSVQLIMEKNLMSSYWDKYRNAALNI